MEGNQIRFNECSNSDIEKLVASAVPESTKKSKNTLSMSLKVKKVTSTLLKFSPKQI